VLIALVLGAGALTVFILRQLRLPEPILEFRVFLNRTFTVATVIGMLAFMALIGAETILPIYMQNMAGFTALESGRVIMPGALLMGIMSPIAGRIFDRIGARLLAIVGLSIVTVTTLFFTQLSTETSLTYITIAFGIRMFGISMVMMPVTTAGLNALRSDLIPHGTAMNNTMRQVAASIGTAILVTVMTMTALADAGRLGAGAGGGEAAVAGAEAIGAGAQIHGVNVAFAAATGLSLVALILSFALPGRLYRRRLFL
jgi:predicted MFS family arabinose efflux permease